MKKIQFERRITLRLPEELAEEIDASVKISGMSFTEFLRRACREKLDRESGKIPGLSEEIDQALEKKMLAWGYKKPE